MERRLEGRVALVTGGMSGLGEACVTRFEKEGATAVTLDVTAGADHHVDVRDEAAVQAAVDAVVAAHGRLDIVVNAAGVAGGGPVHLLPLEEWERVIGVNLGQSFIWQVSNRFNAMLETVWTSGERVVGPGQTVRNQDIFVSPGVRWAYNFKSGLQIVPGIGVPVGVGPTSGEKGIIGYLSFEHPFAWSHSKRK